MDFSLSLEKFPSCDSTSNSTCDTSGTTNCSIDYTTSRHASDQWFYSSSSTSSSVSGPFPDSLGFEDYAPIVTKKDCEDLYPLMEVMDGKEVITITTSNTVPTTSTLSISVPASRSHFMFPYKGVQNMSSRDIDNGINIKYIPQTSERNRASSTKVNLDSTLMTPGAFLSESSYSTTSGHIPDRVNPSNTPIRGDDIYENVDVSTKVDTCTSSRQDCLTATSQLSHLNCKFLNSKESLKGLDVLLTPKRFAHSQDTESSNENTSCGLEVDLISNVDDFEQDLKAIEQLEEDDQKETDTQPCQKSSYDVGRLPPIGVFWDIENCQVCSVLIKLFTEHVLRTRVNACIHWYLDS